MQVSIETTSGLERRLTIGVPAAEIDNEVNSRLKKAAHNVRIDGFRQGKVPFKIIKRRFGAGVRQEVLGDVMNESFYKAIEQEDIRPAGQPSVEPTSMEEGSDLEFVATFEVYPEIDVVAFDILSVENPIAEVTEADMDTMIETVRQQQASYEPVERQVAMEDQVTIDYEGTKDGEAFEGGTAEGSTLVLGSNSMIPGFEDAIVGMSAGEEKVVQLTFPEDYHAEDLKGADAEFKIKVTEVAEKTLPELDDEFYEKFGVTEGGEEAFRKEVRKNMERELKQASKNKVKGQIMDGLVAGTQFDLPRAVVATEIDALRNQAFQQFGGAGAAQLDSSILPDDLFQEQAEKRVTLGLILAEIVKKEEIKADADKVRQTIEEMASTYEDPEQVIEWYYSNQQQMASVESLVIEEQVVEKILNSATVTEKTSSYEEVMKPAQPTQNEEEVVDENIPEEDQDKSKSD